MRLAIRSVSIAAAKGSMVKCGMRKNTSERFLTCALLIWENPCSAAIRHSSRHLRRADSLKATVSRIKAAAKCYLRDVRENISRSGCLAPGAGANGERRVNMSLKIKKKWQ